MSDRAPRRSGMGLLLLAVGKRDGFAQFGADTHAYLSSLAPLVAFALVSGGIIAAAGKWLVGVELFLVSLIGIVAPVVIAEPFCRRWQREARWALYANIMNWSKLLFVMLAPMALGLASAVPAAAGVIVLAFFAYASWFQWFAARGALGIGGWRAALLVLATQGGSNLLVLLPLFTDHDERLQLLGK